MSDLISEKTIIAGTQHSSVIDISVGAKELDLFIDRTYLTDPDIACAVQLFLSLDGGKSWKPWGGFGTVGGEIKDDAQKVQNKSGMRTSLPQPENKNRKIMATITATAELKTSLQYELAS
jgi:hypothetical protein